MAFVTAGLRILKSGKELTASARLARLTLVNKLAGAVLITALSAGVLTAQDRPGVRYVGKVTFKGNEALDAALLSASIATTASSWLYRLLKIGERNEFDETEFRRDVVRLQLLYRQHGFYEAKVDTTVDRGGRLIKINFRIEEGPPIVVDTVVVTGIDSIRDSSSIANNVPLEKGDRFDRVLFDAAGDSISFAVRDRGYPFASIFRNFTVNRLTRLSSVQYDVLPGTHARIGEIVVQGNTKISEAVVRRALTIREGDEYRATALYNSQRALYRSELYRYANVSIAPDSVVDHQDSLVRVRVQVAEADPFRARAGVGYGTIDCLRTSGSLTFLNFLGGARRLDVVGRVSKIGAGRPLDFGLRDWMCSELKKDRYSGDVNFLASATLSQPVGIVRGAIGSVQLFKERRSEFDVYLLTTFGGALSMRFGVGRNRGIPTTLSYRLSNDQITAEDAQYCIYFNQCDPSVIADFRRPRRQGALSVSMVSQHVDSPVDPSNGQTLTVEATSAARFFGSQVVFHRLVTEGVAYRPWGRRVASARLRGGVIAQGTSRIGGVDTRYLPPSEAFYAGGPTTVRGFGRNEMGPVVYVYNGVDPSGDTLGLRSSPIGSSAIVLANIELRTPTPLLGGKLGVSAFVDGGQLWGYDGTKYIGGGFKITPGLGIFIATPLGPMRLTAAYNAYGRPSGPLYRIDTATNTLVREGDYAGRGRGGSFFSHLQWHFSVGNAF
jgi:outer membrane protein assembly complex protein YaeT